MSLRRCHTGGTGRKGSQGSGRQRRGYWRLSARELALAIHEFNYASDHHYAYGPAKVIAWGGCAGAVLSIAVAVLAFALTRPEPL
jgi:hypothetical protein